MAYATNYFPADGVQTVFNFAFAGVNPGVVSGTVPYLYPEDVKAAELFFDIDGNPTALDRIVTITAPNQATIVGAPVAAGRTVKIYRSTEIRFPLVDYRDKQTVSELDLDLASRQAIFIAQETNDAASQNLALDKFDNYDAKDRRIINLAPGVDLHDAVNLEQVDNKILRTVRAPLGETMPPLANAATRAGRILGFDSLGNPEAFIPADGTAMALALALRNALLPDEGDTMVGHYVAGGVGTTVNQELTAYGLRPESFGAVGNGVAEDSAAIQLWINALTLTGLKGYGTPGAIYKVSVTVSKVLVEGNTLSIDMRGARFLQGANNVVLAISNSIVGSIVPAVTIVEAGVNLGDGSTSTRVMTINAVGHPFTEEGQIGKVFSDDIVPDFDGSNQFCGEFFVVGSVIDADNFTTTGIFDEIYLTNPKVVRPSTATLQISNFAGFSVLDSVRNASFVNITGLIQPVLDGTLRANDLNGVFLNLTSCCRATVEQVIGNRLKNRPDQGAYGYLVNDSASWYSIIRNIDATHVRHAYTTSTPTSAVADDNRWDLRGRTIGSDCIDGRGHGCANAFDTHSPALRIRFINCVAVDDYRGYATGGSGIQIRGSNCEVINCDVTNSKFGLAQSGASKTSPCLLTVRGLRYRGPTGHTPISVGGNATFATTVYFDDCDLDSEAQTIFDITNAKVVIRNTDVRIAPTANGASIVTLREGGNVTWRGGSVDIASGIAHNIVLHDATLTTAYVDNMAVTGVNTRLSYLGASASQYSIISRFTNIQLDASLPGVPFLGTAAVDPTVSAQFVVGYAARPLAYRQQVYGSSGNKAIDLQFAGDAHIFIRIECTVDTVTLNSLTQGAYAGQQLTINNRDSSGFNLTVQTNSAGHLQLGTAAILRPGEGLSLTWEGSNWRSGNKHREP